MAALYEILPHHELDERVESATRRASLWDEGKDKLSIRAGSGFRWDSSNGLLHRARGVQSGRRSLLLDERLRVDPLSTQRIEDLICQIKPTIVLSMSLTTCNRPARISDYTRVLISWRAIEVEKPKRIFTRSKQNHT